MKVAMLLAKVAPSLADANALVGKVASERPGPLPPFLTGSMHLFMGWIIYV